MKRISVVVIGCNYGNSNIALKGCINDAIDFSQTMYDLGIQHNYDIKLTLLTDNNPNRFPSRKTIEDTIEEQIDLCNRNKIDCFVFYFAGHGIQVKDNNSDEKDGKDETILTGDRQYIKDDQFRDHLARLKNKSTNVLFVFDCCHSGSILDLPRVILGNKDTENKNVLHSKTKIVCISACADTQESTEVNGRGIFTQYFCQSIRNNKDSSFYSLLKSLRNRIKDRQNDMSLTLSCNKRVNMKKSSLFKIAKF